MDRIDLLDHGYLRIVDVWGRDGLDDELGEGDHAIIAAARMSTGKNFQGWGGGWKCSNDTQCDWKDTAYFERRAGDPCPHCRAPIVDIVGDEKLLKYLHDNKHSTPFEMCGATFEVQAPIFVFREWHRHRVPFGYSEASARYAPLPDLNYIPTVERLMRGGGHLTKQAGTVAGAEALTEEGAKLFQRQLEMKYRSDEAQYRDALAMGVPKELARIGLPVGRYSKMRATGNLRGWLGFMALRSAPNAQEEIRVYSRAIGTILSKHFPRTMALFNGGR
jgi:thymidylate synthase (FAD)